MLLSDYLKRRGDGAITRLVGDAKVAFSTVHDVLNGRRICRLETAQKISDATRGRVSVADLMLREQPKRPRPGHVKRARARAAA